MLIAYDEKAFQFSDTRNFSGVSLSYPIGIFDKLNSIIYYDWTTNSVYNFVNWYRQFNRTTFYIMGYWNPEDNKMPIMGAVRNLYGGKGVQIMFVFNH